VIELLRGGVGGRGGAWWQVMYELHVEGMGLPLPRREALLAGALGHCRPGVALSGYTLDIWGFGLDVQLERVSAAPPWRGLCSTVKNGRWRGLSQAWRWVGHGAGRGAKQVLQRAPAERVRVLVLARTNLVKHAVAEIRDELFSRRCGHANKVAGERCDVPRKLLIDTSVLVQRLYEVAGMVWRPLRPTVASGRCVRPF
jgi:hypothetical protein